MLPESLAPSLREQLSRARAWWLKEGRGRSGVALPDALERKYPRAGHSWPWFWVLRSTRIRPIHGAVSCVAITWALLQRLAAVRGRLSLCADQAAAAKWWLSMPMASVSAEPMPKALSTRRTSPLMPGCRHQGEPVLCAGLA